MWLATVESETSEIFREKMIAASSRDAIRSKGRTGKPARQLRSVWTDAWDRGADSPGALPMPLQSIISRDAFHSIERSAAAGNAQARDLVSYFVGLLCMIALIVAFRDPVPTAAMAARIPFWAWSGGLFGAIFIALGILLVPKIGAATFIALLVAGQMLASVAFDHFGLLGLTQRPVDVPRLIGVALLIGGVLLIRRP